MVKSGTPSLVDDALSRVGRQGPKAEVVRLADTMPPALRAEFVAAVNNPDVPAAGLARALTARGYRIREQAISRFRLRGDVLA